MTDTIPSRNSTTTFGTFKTRILAQADLPANFANNIKSDYLDDIANDALQELWDILIQAYDDDFQQEELEITVSAGSTYYDFTSLPSSWYSYIPYHITKVEFQHNSQKYPVERFNQSSAIIDARGREWGPTIPRYDYRVPKMWFDPIPLSEETLTIHYIHVPPIYTSDSNIMHFLLHLHMRPAVLAGAITLRMKADLPANSLEKQKQGYIDHIFRRVVPIDFGKPLPMADDPDEYYDSDYVFDYM